MNMARLGYSNLLSLAEQSELDIFLTENIYIYHIHPSKFLIAILVFFIKKRDNSL